MKHAKHAVDCRCNQCWPMWPMSWQEMNPPIYAYAYFQPWGYPETHGRHVLNDGVYSLTVPHQ